MLHFLASTAISAVISTVISAVISTIVWPVEGHLPLYQWC